VKASIIDGKLAGEICVRLKEESPELIDFDALGDLLTQVQDTAEKYNQAIAELAKIKGHYRDRIVGMLKANIVCRRDEGDMELAAKLSGEPDEVGSDELIRLYGKVAARFRSNFPASYKYLTYSSRAGRQRDWREHKI
jgi:hypothetical protein